MSNGTTQNGVARDPEDFFAETRMPFTEHIEELRRHLWRAIAGLGICMVIGFVMDGIGTGLKLEFAGLPFGIGRPLLVIMQTPVERALRAYDDRRAMKADADLEAGKADAVVANEWQSMKVSYTRSQLARLRGVTPDQVKEDELEVTFWARPFDVDRAARSAESFRRPRVLTTLSVQEAMVVYFKVSLVAGLVIASPWVFWQIWSFVAAGLYPHEKRLIHVYLPFSLFLFLAGVMVCQFLVMPKAVEAMLWFNEWLGMTPDLRLNEWLSFAIWMPLVFGVSFQTPLVMLFAGKLGVADAKFFSEKRKYAIMFMCVFAAMITPSADAISMLFLAVPMCLLYELGIVLVKLQPPAVFDEADENSDELIEV